MAALQVTAGLSGSRIFTQKPVQPPKAPQAFGLSQRHTSFSHLSAFNSYNASSETAPRQFVRPDCPPVESEQEQTQPKRLRKVEAPKQGLILNGRSALEQVSFFTNTKLQEEEKRKPNKFGIFGFGF